MRRNKTTTRIAQEFQTNDYSEPLLPLGAAHFLETFDCSIKDHK
jgi:hypothetical protein